MMYPFMTLDDNTGIAHSDAYDENGIETVKIYFEKPIYGGFHSAECYLPSYEWKNIDGFTDEEIKKYEEFLHSVSHIVIRLARKGGAIMPQIFKVGSYLIYFWLNEGKPLEPIHVHVSEGFPSENSAKYDLLKII